MLWAKNAYSQRILEDQRRSIVNLVRRPPQGNAQGGAGWLGFMHG